MSTSTDAPPHPGDCPPAVTTILTPQYNYKPQNTYVKTQGSGGKTLPSIARARHLLALIGCCPLGELEDTFPALARELLTLLRRTEADNTRVVALAAVDEILRRLLQTAAPGSAGGRGRGGSGTGGGGSKVGAEFGGARQVRNRM